MFVKLFDNFFYIPAKYNLQKIRFLRHQAIPSQNLPVINHRSLQNVTNMYAKQYVTKRSSASEIQPKENAPRDESPFLGEGILHNEYLDGLDKISFDVEDNLQSSQEPQGESIFKIPLIGRPIPDFISSHLDSQQKYIQFLLRHVSFLQNVVQELEDKNKNVS